MDIYWYEIKIHLFFLETKYIHIVMKIKVKVVDTFDYCLSFSNFKINVLEIVPLCNPLLSLGIDNVRTDNINTKLYH